MSTFDSVPAEAVPVSWRQPWERPFQLLGFKWFDPANPVYCRLPEHPDVSIRPPVMHLAMHTAGGQVRFRTDSRIVRIRATLPGVGNMDHMARTGQDGFDLYTGPPGAERFVGVTRIKGAEIDAVLFRSSERAMRDFRLNFPLYCGVRKIEIGLDQDARIEPPTPLADSGCIVVYGTSITQGGCAPRPGMAYTNILSRRLNREVVNLGFSGNGLGDIEIAQLIARIPNKRMVILDYEANANDGVRTTLGPFVDELRKADPRMPILVVSKIRYAEESISPAALKRREGLREFQKRFVEERRANGDDRIFFFDGSAMLGSDWWECTVDGHHATALGFYRMTLALEPAIQDILTRVRVEESADSTIRLWPDGAPGGWRDPEPERTETDKDGIVRVQHVSDPTLTVYLPDRHLANGVGVVICPGGGYHILAIEHEGHEVARRLCGRGFAAFLLKYRLPRPEVDKVRYAAALQDAQRALRIVRAHAEQWSLRSIGIMGFSAGAHLSAVAATNSKKNSYPPADETDAFSCRPDFAALIYPAYLAAPDTGRLAAELPVTEDTPPCFLAQTEDDRIPVENSLFFYRALKQNNVPAEMHLYASGGHGYGLRAVGKPIGAWIDLLENWLARQPAKD